MILGSTLVMDVLMYLNTYELDHIARSQTGDGMALMMSVVIAVVMAVNLLVFMRDMSASRATIWSIVAAGSLWFMRG